MRNVVISGSVSQQEAALKWVEFWNRQADCQVIDWPKPISKDVLTEQYPHVFQEFYKAISDADILFVVNEAKNGVEGYIGSGVFAEIAFAIASNLVYGKQIEILLTNQPSDEVHAFDELTLWLHLGWIRMHTK